MVLLLTGATGFLGNYLVEALDQYDLRLITRSPEKLQHTKHEIVKADITQEIDTAIFDDVDIFIHSAAKVGSWPPHRSDGYEATNINATENLLTKAIDIGINKIIYTSSYFALGATGDEIADEKWDNKPDFSHPYVTTKYDAGKIVDELAKDYPITQLHPTVIMGPGINNSISHTLIDYINGKLLGLPGGGKSMMNMVSVSDVALAHKIAVTQDLPGKYIVGGENISFRTFIEQIARRLNIGVPRSIPYWSATFYAWLLERFGSPSFTRADVSVIKRNYQYSSAKLQSHGYDPQPINDILDPILHDFLDRDALTNKGKKRVITYFSSKI